MNQGYDVIEFINGNSALKPADEPIIAEKFAASKDKKSVDEWLKLIGQEVEIFRDLSPLQLRELMLDSDVRIYQAGEVIFYRNAPGSSMFAIAKGSVAVEINAADPPNSADHARIYLRRSGANIWPQTRVNHSCCRRGSSRGTLSQCRT